MYKHFLSVSSQIAFCSAPIRLDSFNACQFSCGYCYARARTGAGRDAKLAYASAKALEARLARVERGEVSSALDEFLHRRTPLQFGGMSDPFMPLERRTGVSLDLMRTLKHYEYPYLISTKGNVVFDDNYIDALTEADVLVRFSFAGCSDMLRREIDRGALEYNEFLSLIPKLRDRGIKLGLRLQPLIPGEEAHAVEMLRRLPNGLIDHVSAEFLKVPVSADRKFSPAILKHFSGSIISWYRAHGATLRGNEYVLDSNYRKSKLYILKAICVDKKISFGFADNDLLLLSDGQGCCSGADLHLKRSNLFEGNTLGLLRRKLSTGKTLSEFDRSGVWMPEMNIAQYLNSKTRIYRGDSVSKYWEDYAFSSWNGDWGQYSYKYFLEN